MKVRTAVEQDIPAVLALYEDYTGDNMKRLNVEFKPDIVEGAVKELVKHGRCIVAEIEGRIIGAIVGEKSRCMFADDVFYTALLFYFKAGYRHWTREFFERLTPILKEMGVTRFVVASPAFDDHEKLSRFYRMCGFELLESHYSREVK